MNPSPAITSVEDFLTLLEDELGVRVDPGEVDRPLEDFAEWDSVHLLRLVTVVENVTGRRVRVADLLEATTFRQIHKAAVSG